MTERIISVLLVAVVALGAMTGVAAADGDLGVAVDDTDGEPTVTVTANETAVENATVTVSAADAANESYAGTGEYTTDENGTIALPAPEETVTVDVTASSANETASTTVELTAGDEADADRSFGQVVSEYIDSLADRSGGIGDAVSDFVTETNRGNAPDRAGGFDDSADDSDTENESDGPGNAPADAGPSDDERGPPDHAGGADEKANADDDDVDDDADDDDVDDDENNANDDDVGEDDADEADADEDDTDEDENDADEDDGNGPGNGNGPPDDAPGN